MPLRRRHSSEILPRIISSIGLKLRLARLIMIISLDPILHKQFLVSMHPSGFKFLLLFLF